MSTISVCEDAAGHCLDSSNVTTAPVAVSAEEGPVLIIGVIFELVLTVLIISGNGMVVTAVYRFRSLQTVTNYFLVSLAMADLLMGIALPFHISLLLLPDLSKKTYFCVTRIILLLFPGVASANMLVEVAVDRYIAIVYPLHYRAWVTPRCAALLIAVGWLLAVVMTFYPFFYNSHMEPQTCKFDTSLHPSSCYWFFIFFILTLVILVLLYGRIFFEAWRQLRRIRHAQDVDGSSSGTKQSSPINFRQEARTAKTLAIVMGAFVCSWLPFQVLIFLVTLGVDVEGFNVLYPLTIPIVVINSCMNPGIYACRNKRFRRAFRKLLTRSNGLAGLSIVSSNG